MKGITEVLAEHAVKTRFADVPEAVVHLAKLRVLDMLGCMLYGGQADAGRLLTEVTQELGGSGRATVVGERQQTNACVAAFVNAGRAHSFEMDDFNYEAGTHAGSVVVPAAMALAETQGASGRSFLTAVVLGHDVACRIGSAVRPGERVNARGFHGQGGWAAFGAATAAAKVLQLDKQKVQSAFAMAATQAFSMLLVGHSGQGKPFHAAKSAMAGVVAAVVAEGGLVGPSDVLNGDEQGRYPGYLDMVTDKANPDRVLWELGESYELQRDGSKMYAGDGCLHSGIEALLSLVEEHRIARGEVEAIHVSGFSNNVTVNGIPRPRPSTLEAFASYQHCLAVALVYGRVTPDEFTGDVVESPEVDQIRQKVRISVDPELDRLYPLTRGASVDVITKRGTFGRRLLYAKGRPDNPASDGDIVQKFRNLTGRMLSQEKADEVINKVFGLEELQDVNGLTSLLRP